MKKQNVYLCLLFLIHPLITFSQGTCGHFLENYATGDDLFYDRFGNSYLSINNSFESVDASTNLFQFSYRDDISDEIQAIIELVFLDLEKELSITQNQYSCGTTFPLGMPTIDIFL